MNTGTRLDNRVRFLVLGAAAGGGLPQWNCNCFNCAAARDPNSGIKPQTQSSLAVSDNGTDWAIFNASPDMGQQILANAQLHPRHLRHSPVKSVVITNGDIDHVGGLLTLREKQAFGLYATRAIHAQIDQNPIFGVLDPAHVTKHAVELGQDFRPLETLDAQIFPVPGKVPLYLEGSDVEIGVEGENTVGVEFVKGTKRAYYIPGCADITPALADRLRGADLVLFDGTVFFDDEMATAGTGTKTGRRMGHMPISGEGGSLERLARLEIVRMVYVHINNTNPIFRDGPERQQIEAAGFEIAYDGMEIQL